MDLDGGAGPGTATTDTYFYDGDELLLARNERLHKTERTCGVWVIDIQRGQIVAFLKFEEAVQEVFAVCLVPGICFPDLINDNTELIGSSFVLPDAALRDVPIELQASS